MDIPVEVQEEYSFLISIASVALLLLAIYIGLILIEWGLYFSAALVKNIRTAAYVVTTILVYRAFVYWDKVGTETFMDDLGEGIWDVTLANLTIVYEAVYEHPACGLLFLPIPLFLSYKQLIHNWQNKIDDVVDTRSGDFALGPRGKEENAQDSEVTHNEPIELDDMNPKS